MARRQPIWTGRNFPEPQDDSIRGQIASYLSRCFGLLILLWTFDGNRLKMVIDQLFGSIRIADLLDIGVIAILLHFVLKWFRRRASRALAISAAALAILYGAAHRLEMILTSMLFQFGFTAALFTLIVVFQSDIRRSVERLSSWTLRRKSLPLIGETAELDALSESIAVLAENRIGALLVFEGHEPIERHLQGGVRVEARISLPLLHSIFHPASPGHDGAVVFEGDRIDKLGVHLPLSKNLAEIGDGGTRHAAALGLSERSDALVIVVSEERGTISIAEHGRLARIDPTELKPLLERRQWKCRPAPQQARHPWAPREVAWMGISLLLAIGLWAYVADEDEIAQRTYVVPVEYHNIAKGYVIQEGAGLAAITLSGSKRAFNLLDVRALVASADVGAVVPGVTRYVTTAGPTDLPPGLRVTQIDPRRVPVTLARFSPGGPQVEMTDGLD